MTPGGVSKTLRNQFCPHFFIIKNQKKNRSHQHKQVSTNMMPKLSTLLIGLAVLALSHARIEGEYERPSLSRLILDCDIIGSIGGSGDDNGDDGPGDDRGENENEPDDDKEDDENEPGDDNGDNGNEPGDDNGEDDN